MPRDIVPKRACATRTKAEVEREMARLCSIQRASDYVAEPARLNGQNLLKLRPLALESSEALQLLDDLLDFRPVMLDDLHVCPLS